jgi:outer membrane protein
MKRYFIYIVFISSVSISSGQEIWTFEKCMETGMKNSLDFQLAQLDVLSAEKTYRPAAMEYLPRVTANASHNYSIGSTIDPATNNRVSSNIQSDNVGLNAEMDIINFNIFTQARRNKIALLKSKADKEAIINEYLLSLLENYFNVLYTQELLKIQQSQFENAKFNLNRVEKECGLGSRPKSDLYDMQLSYAQEENAIIETQQILENQKLLLLQIMNITGTNPDSFSVAPFNLPTFTETADVNAVYETTLKNNPKIKAAGLAEQVAAKNVNIERNKYLPVLSLYYNYSSFYYKQLNGVGNTQVPPFWTQINDNKNHNIGVSLTIPIFNGFRTHRDVQLAKIEREKKRVNSEKEKMILMQSIEQETAKQRQSLALISKMEATVVTAQKSFATTQAKFTNGLVEAVIFTTAKNQLTMAEYNLLRAKFTAQYQYLKLNLIQYNSI